MSVFFFFFLLLLDLLKFNNLENVCVCIYIYIYMNWVQVTHGATLSNITPFNIFLIGCEF